MVVCYTSRMMNLWISVNFVVSLDGKRVSQVGGNVNKFLLQECIIFLSCQDFKDYMPHVAQRHIYDVITTTVGRMGSCVILLIGRLGSNLISYIMILLLSLEMLDWAYVQMASLHLANF